MEYLESVEQGPCFPECFKCPKKSSFSEACLVQVTPDGTYGLDFDQLKKEPFSFREILGSSPDLPRARNKDATLNKISLTW